MRYLKYKAAILLENSSKSAICYICCNFKLTLILRANRNQAETYAGPRFGEAF
jgi:hypothetical protein